jgi:hypothetical protein
MKSGTITATVATTYDFDQVSDLITKTAQGVRIRM